MYSKEAFEAMTVVELRKVARENGVTLSAGISKQGIVERLCAALVKPEEDAAAEAETEETEGEEAAPADFMDRVNPHSLTVQKGFCEKVAQDAEAGATWQFLRMGYFCKDPDSTQELSVFNRTVPLKDSWAKTQK